MKTNKNTKLATIVLLFLLGMTLVVFAYHIKEFIVNGTMIPWPQFTIMYAMITIGFAGVAKSKKIK